MSQIEIYRDQVHALAEAGATVEVIMSTIEPALAAIYQAAEGAGDEDTKSRVMTAWGNTQALRNQYSAADAVAHAGAAMIEHLAAEFEALVDALEARDMSHPEVADALEGAFDDAYEVAEAEMSEYIYDLWYQDIGDTVQRVGRSWKESGRLIDYLKGDFTPGGEVDAMLCALIDKLNEVWDDDRK